MPLVSLLGWCYPTKELNTCVHEKEDIWKGVCWSIMKTVWHYSDRREPLYLYLLDNAMFRWLYAENKQLQGKLLYGALTEKGTLIAYKQSVCCDMTNMNGKKHTGPGQTKSQQKVSGTVFICARLSSALLTLSMGIKSCMKKQTFPFVLCVSLMTLFMTTREEMF